MANVVQIPNNSPRRKALASVKRGVLSAPLRVLIYGAEKVGKSTFAAGAPKPVFIGAESGTVNLDVDRVQPANWNEAVGFIEDMATEEHPYKTLVLDPINWLEPMCWAKVIELEGKGSLNIEEVGGGFSKGYEAALNPWREMQLALERCWTRGMNVVLCAHALVKNFKNPHGPAYDRFEIAMHAKAAGVFKQWVDAVLFAELQTFTNVDKRTKRVTGVTSGARIIHTMPSAAYDAGSRWKLPEELPLSWDDFVGAVESEKGRGAELLARIDAMLDELGDDAAKTAARPFIEKHKSNADRLAELANRIAIKIEEKKAKEATAS
jgi:hypothetical protein